ncbi:type I DNA topoisomerase [Sedimentisphaera salicampi]|uniref:DNA topoisomerase 1 n=1 Tax=Sedimentisphaera salicampi TaxID=1941349 RepID=A0A1W6LN90_9BACT|nr:type I DNA topoisomerase [Sedimentisphaera salicampi]ARN57212.1 DNA topoisomerase 1 [Sedimentisphaera salicampi]
MKNLVIVESPAKAKTINKYLGSEFEVKASNGHIRDLPSKGINVDIENGFQPTYDITPGKKKLVGQLRSAAKKCDNVYLATDLDREGEAIAWHLAKVLGVSDEHTYRVVFNAITKNSIRQAFADPGKLDMAKVNAQQARRILDRIVGYQISPLLWKKVAGGLSAGRVQSVAVKIVAEREKEIRAFNPEEYWLIPAVFTTDLDQTSNGQHKYAESWEQLNAGEKKPSRAELADWFEQHNAFKAELARVGGKKFGAKNQQQAEEIFHSLSGQDFTVSSVEKKESKSRPLPPFITSTLQQAASNRSGFGAKRTMRIAQSLYEGVDLGGLGTIGLITYMRTDSTYLSPEALNAGRKYISEQLGADYLPDKPNFYASSKAAQEAHEAIRPTDPSITPQQARPHLSDEQFRLYDLIWRRFIASQMTPAKWFITSVKVCAQAEVGECEFRASGRMLAFDGFTKIWQNRSTEQQLPEMREGQKLAAADLRPEQHFTKPPARYTEASLVKALEKEGIGRPSTYASIISTIQDRKYVEQIDKKLRATDLGIVVTEKLEDFFPEIMDIAFTRQMEENLDGIEEKNNDWVRVLEEFYGPFSSRLEQAKEQMKHAKAETTPSDYNCPDCGAKLEYRFGKNGRFLSCSKYPECKYACPCDSEGKPVKEEKSGHKCPNCGKDMVVKTGRYGKFLGCEDYPKCKTIMKIDKEGNVLPPAPPPEPTGIRCQKCKNGELVVRQSKRGPFLGCNKFPRCRNIISIKMLDRLKELQNEGVWPPDTIEEADEILGRKKTAAKKKTAKKTTKKTTKKSTKKTAKKTAKKTTKKTSAKKKTSE